MLRKIFGGSPWELRGAFGGSDGLDLIYRHRNDIFAVICEHNPPDGDWKLLLAEIGKLPVRPHLIVASRLADERLWAEVLNLGAFDLLSSDPFVPAEVLHVTRSAWLAWNRASQPWVVPRAGLGRALSPAASGEREFSAVSSM
jgi:hypothetical protein